MKVSKNAVVTLDFKVYDVDTNEILEDTEELGPFRYIHGTEGFIDKIEEAVDGEEKGFNCSVEVFPEEAYGEYDEDLVEEVDREEFSEFDDIYEGLEFEADMDDGSVIEYVVKEIDGDKITIDGNHPFSGKCLKFELTVADVRPATKEELEHGHPHFDGFHEEE
ncbi:MAG: FKBP-type peptidyl-prolyl cis-trans isomerase [Fusobacteriaceae bacterium]